MYGTRSQCPLTSIKTRRLSGLYLAETFSTSPLKSETTEWNSRKVDRKQDLNVPIMFVFFGLIRKTRWSPRPLIGRDICDLSYETAETELKDT